VIPLNAFVVSRPRKENSTGPMGSSRLAVALFATGIGSGVTSDQLPTRTSSEQAVIKAVHVRAARRRAGTNRRCKRFSR
jgi:hypothetical protein